MKNRWYNLLIDCGVFAVTVIIAGTLARLNCDPHHDGIMFEAACRAAEGKALFREVFCQYGDLSVLMQAAVIRICGASLLSLRLLTVAFYGGIGVLHRRIWSRIIPERWGQIGSMVMFWGLGGAYLVPFHIWSSVYALFFVYLAVWLWLERRDFACGAAIALAVMCRLPAGLAGLTAITAAAILRQPKKLVRFALGFLIPLTAGAIKITLESAWSDYFRQCWGWVIGFALKRGGIASHRPFAEVWNQLARTFFPFDLFDAVWGVLPLAVLGYAGCGLYRYLKTPKERRQTNPVKVLLVLLALTSWHQYYPVPCVRHLFWAGIPMFGLWIAIVIRVWRKRRILAALLLVPPALSIALRLYAGSFRLGMLWRNPVETVSPLQGLTLSGDEAHLFAALRRDYGLLPEELRRKGVFNFTPDGIFCRILPAPPIPFRHPMFVNWTDEVYRDYPALAERYILENRPNILSSTPLDLPGYQLISSYQLRGESYYLYVPTR